ncbi:MAG: hypothetical protein ACLFSQ_03215 [Candidatus Zixiibacteriota bacterium]
MTRRNSALPEAVIGLFIFFGMLCSAGFFGFRAYYGFQSLE